MGGAGTRGESVVGVLTWLGGSVRERKVGYCQEQTQYGIRRIVAVAMYLWISVINNTRRGSELWKETGSVYLREVGDGKVRSFAGCVSYYPPHGIGY